MADINYKEPLVKATFTGNMQAWLSVIEGTPADDTTPYCDSTGHPTVSVGVNLTVPKYLQQYILDAETNGQSSKGSAQEASLDNLLSKTYTSQSAFENAVADYVAQYGTLPTLTTTQATAIFNYAYSYQYNVLFNPTKPTKTNPQPLGLACYPSYNIDVSALENSDEGLALMSLSYNLPGGVSSTAKCNAFEG